MSERPDSAQKAFDDFRDAWHEFALELAYALRIPKLLDWLTKKIGGHPPESETSLWVVDLAKTSPYSIDQLVSYERQVRDVLKSQGVTDASVVQESVRVGVDIALAENRRLGYDHIPGV